MCIMWTGNSFHPFSCTCLLAILVCQYHTFGLLFKHQLAVLQVSSLCWFLPLWISQQAPAVSYTDSSCPSRKMRQDPTGKCAKEGNIPFFFVPHSGKKHSLRIQFLKAELSKKPLNVHKKVSTAFSLKFTLITSFWPKKNIENKANNTYLLISFSILQFKFILLVLCLSFYAPHNLPKKLFSVDILKLHVLQSPTALPNYVSSVQFTMLRGHRKMGSRKVFESLQNQST